MPRSRKQESWNRYNLLALLDKHNDKFPDTALDLKFKHGWIILENKEKNFSKTGQGVIKAYNYLKNRYYYNRRGTSPRLGYKVNNNRASK